MKDFHYYLCRRLGGGMEIVMKFVDNKKKYSLLKLGAVVIAALVILDIIGRKYEKRYFTVPIKLKIK